MPIQKKSGTLLNAPRIYGEMADFDKSDKIIKTSGKVNKSNT